MATVQGQHLQKSTRTHVYIFNLVCMYSIMHMCIRTCISIIVDSIPCGEILRVERLLGLVGGDILRVVGF